MLTDPFMAFLLVLLLGLGAAAVLLLKHILGIADRMADQEAQLSAERHARHVAEGNVARLRNRLLAAAETPGEEAGPPVVAVRSSVPQQGARPAENEEDRVTRNRAMHGRATGGLAGGSRVSGGSVTDGGGADGRATETGNAQEWRAASTGARMSPQDF